MMHNKPTFIDLFILGCFTVLITLQPYFLHGEINLYELGLYLPGINAILDGAIPFKDFFHLRGPLELYIPAFMMLIFGENVSILAAYFYSGTILTLLCCVFIGYQLFQTRLFLYLFVPVMIARTFPRVVFTFWGGFRFAIGLMALSAAIQYFKTKQLRWILLSGIFSACGFWTSIEVGACSVIGIIAAFIIARIINSIDHQCFRKGLGVFAGGFIAGLVPFTIYLLFNNALAAYFDSFLTVVTRMTIIFPQTNYIPQNIWEAFLNTVNPASKNFRHMTPVYCYVFFTIYMIYTLRKKKIDILETSAIIIALYGLTCYVSAFRSIWTSQFEMALQPEKILLFFLLERVYFAFRQYKQLNQQVQWKIFVINFLILGIVMSSICYSFARFNHRFIAFKWLTYAVSGKSTVDLKPLDEQSSEELKLARLRGMVAPKKQVQDFQGLTKFFNENSQRDEQVLVFPDIGALNFIIDRPFVGRFPMVVLSWLKDSWHDGFVEDLHSASPRFVITYKELRPHFEDHNFINPQNKIKFNEVSLYVNQNYEVAHETPTYLILEKL